MASEVSSGSLRVNLLVFITVMESVYSAVRTDSLYKADYVSPLKGEQHLY